jgi:hypothetical protein
MSNSGFTLEIARRRVRRAPPSLRASLVRMLRASLTKDTAFFALPEEERSERRAANGFCEGALAGAPDLVLIHGGRAFGLELKAYGSGLSDEERAAQVTLRAAGMRVEVARDVNEALVRLREMGIPLKLDIANVFRGRAA